MGRKRSKSAGTGTHLMMVFILQVFHAKGVYGKFILFE